MRLRVGAADDRYEREADRLASQVVQRLSTAGAPPANAMAGAPAAGVQRAIGEHVIRRLQSTDDFKTASGKRGLFSGIKKVDKKLDDYHLVSGSLKDITARKAALTDLKTTCDSYKGSRPEVVTLSAAIDEEAKFIDLLVKAAGELTSDPKAAFQTTLASREAFLEATRAGHVVGSPLAYDQWISAAQQKLAALRTRKSAMKEIIDADVDKLEKMSTDDQVDDTVQKILKEVLENKDDIYAQETGGVASGAVLATDKDRANGVDKKYRLDMQLDQKEGETERLSSLVHEMTHIAVHETFDNTAIHLAMKGVDLKDTTARSKGIQAGKALSDHRTAEVRVLEGLLPKLKGILSAGQIGVIEEKVTYPVEGKNTLKSYADAFKKKGELSDEEHAFILDLEAAGANNTLTEYDTVVNQMMFLVASWKVPRDNEFYVKVKQMANDGLVHRAS